jgi:hypothetical protein
MKTIKVAEATNTQLDWLVAKALGAQWVKTPESQSWLMHWPSPLFGDQPRWSVWVPEYTTDPAQGLLILDRELIDTYYDIHWVREALDPEDNGERWYASPAGNDELGFYGVTRLVAGLRVFVALTLGETVEVPLEHRVMP